MKDNFCRCHQFGKRLYQTHFDHFKVMEELKNMSLPKIVNIYYKNELAVNFRFKRNGLLSVSWFMTFSTWFWNQGS